MNNNDKYNLQRFVKAQELKYEKAKQEIVKGKKRTHWMWYIFPQLKGLGQSDKAVYYGISGIDEAKAYCQHNLLHNRYIEMCQLLLQLNNNNIVDILGDIDALKAHSSITLFLLVDTENTQLYKSLLDKYYNGTTDKTTVNLLGANS